jgi:hypothetical protein
MFNFLSDQRAPSLIVDNQYIDNSSRAREKANFITVASENWRVAPTSSVLFVFPLVKDLDKDISPLLLLVFILTDRKLLLDTPALELERHESGEEKHSGLREQALVTSSYPVCK